MILPFRDTSSIVWVTAGAVTPSSFATFFTSLKGFERVCYAMRVATGASGVTPISVVLRQARTVGGSGDKALPFVKAFRKLDYPGSPASQVTAAFDVVNNTFTFDATVSKNNLYMIEVNRTDLDVQNDFDCVGIDFGDGAAQTVDCVALLLGAKSGRVQTNPLVD